MPQSETDRQFGLANGVSPVGFKTICVDFDGTIVPWSDLFSYPKPFDGCREAMQAMRAAGYRIVILTSRMSAQWLKSEDESSFKHLCYVKAILDNNDIPFDAITADKVPAVAYLDDRSVPPFKPSMWPFVEEWVKSGMPAGGWWD